MTAEQYLEKYLLKKINNHITIERGKDANGKNISDGPYCLKCWEDKQELEGAPFSSAKFAWICRHGHVCESDRLSQGGVTYGPT